MKKKIMLSCFLISLFAMAIVFGSALAVMYILSEADIKEQLISQTQVYADIVDTSGVQALTSVENSVFGQTRLTVIDCDGRVVKDSFSDVTELHADREEVIAAIQGEPRVVKRFSETLGRKMYYYALLSDSGYIIRLAVAVSDAGGYVRGAAPMFVLAVIVAAGISLAFAGKLSSVVTKRIEDVRTSLASLNRGEYVPIDATGDPELYGLLAEINALSASIGRHIATERAERSKLNNILDNVSQGIIALGDEMRVLQINKAAEKIFNAGDVTGKRLLWLINDISLVERMGKETCFTADYKNKILFVNVVKTEDIGDIKRIVIISDVTEQQNIIRQKSDFFANASHELKTPLTTMQGMAELLMGKGSADEQTHRFAERIYKESTRLNSLILDMLKLSNLERQMEESAVVTEISLGNVAREVVGEFGSIAEQKRLKTQVIGDANIFADQKKIFELIENLYTNAVNYNREGGMVTIEISNSEGKAEIKVSDTGIGIEKEHIPRLCERFYRVDKSRSKKTGGTGLGLAIVKHICVLYNAEMKIESQLGVGTEVSVTFPQKAD